MAVGQGRGGSFCKDAPLLGPLPAPASRREEAKARFQENAQTWKILIESTLAGFITFLLWWLKLAGVCAGDFTKQLEKASFPLAADGPVDRHALVALVETLALHAKVEATPRRMLADGGNEVVLRLVEREVIVLIEQNHCRRQRACVVGLLRLSHEGRGFRRGLPERAGQLGHQQRAEKRLFRVA